MFKDKGLIIGIVATIILIAGGVFFFSKPASPSSPNKKISQEILAPQDTYIAGGLVNGTYLPATSSAQITLVEFGDYECPACAQYSPLVKQLLTEMPGKINFVFRNFPLTQHTNAPISAQAAEAAGLQGKFWEMHNKLYETQSQWAKETDPTSIFISFAKELGLNEEQFKSDLDSSKVKDKIARDSNDANLINISATPTFYVNGSQMDSLPPNFEAFKKAVTNLASQ